MDMESRSGRRRLGGQPQPPREAGRNCRSRRLQEGDGGGSDRISELSDDLLIQVLVRLGCAAAAARTSVLSRRWRESGLWRKIPELSFRGVAPSALEAALSQLALPKLSLLDIVVPDCDRQTPSAEAVASLLRTAARLDPVEFSIAIFWDHPIPIEFPPFSRTTWISLNVKPFHLTPPGIRLSGEFRALERLSITSGHFDTGAVISRCPHLRVLELINCRGLETITVHSATIKELLVSSDWVRGADIAAPVLKKFTLQTKVPVDFSMSLLAPTVENLSWKCWPPREFSYPPVDELGIDEFGMWCLYNLKLETEESGFVLGLGITRPSRHCVIHVRNLQDMFQFPNISVLELCLSSRGHDYGAVVLQLLMVWNAVQRLKLVIQRDKWSDELCLLNCRCYQPRNWKSQNIFLMGLEEVEIENLRGRDDEVDLLKLLFRCARLTKVTVKLAPCITAGSIGCKEAYNISIANPATECHVYRAWGNEVIYA